MDVSGHDRRDRPVHLGDDDNGLVGLRMGRGDDQAQDEPDCDGADKSCDEAWDGAHGVTSFTSNYTESGTAVLKVLLIL